jgi:hypothetical protein
MSLRFTALGPVRRRLLVACSGKRMSAGQCDDQRSQEIKEKSLPPWPSDNQVSAIENGAVVSICVRIVNGPAPLLFGKYAIN